MSEAEAHEFSTKESLAGGVGAATGFAVWTVGPTAIRVAQVAGPYVDAAEGIPLGHALVLDKLAGPAAAAMGARLAMSAPGRLAMSALDDLGRRAGDVVDAGKAWLDDLASPGSLIPADGPGLPHIPTPSPQHIPSPGQQARLDALSGRRGTVAHMSTDGSAGGGVGAGRVATALGGTNPIPRGTDLALGLGTHLDEFADEQGAVSVFSAWDRSYHQLPIGDPSVLMGNFDALVREFTGSGGRLKFNLTGIRPGVEGVTTWELRRVVASENYLQATDFYRDGEKLTGQALKEALKPWR